MRNTIKTLLNKLPYIKGLYLESKNFKKNACFPAGHFYSTIVNVDEVKQNEHEIWKGLLIDGIKDVDLNTQEQLAIIKELTKFYAEIPFKEKDSSNLLYKFENGMYTYTDGIVLYSMIRYIKPKKIIEVGSGHTSALMLDVNNLFFNNSIELTFIEPFPRRLNSLISNKDKEKAKVLENKVQDIPLETFMQLESGDILFIDSTHVSKCGSDLNFILFEVLPILKEGVFIHFHDVFYPFEYPKEWVYKGYNWNENYILKAFLMNNKDYQIKLFSHYIHLHHKNAFKEMPLTFKNFGGNLWLQKK